MAELARRHIAEQRVRIDRQRTLIDELERRHRGDAFLRPARQHLSDMLNTLDGMLSAQRHAVERADHPAEKTVPLYSDDEKDG